MKIGRKIIYDKVTGDIVKITGERQGYVKETSDLEDYSELDLNIQAVNQLAYGERISEFQNMGSCKMNVETNELIIYPRLTISTDKTEIQSDGIDTATIIVTTQEDCTVTFKVNDGVGYDLATVNKTATFQLTTDLTGDYIVTASSELYGTNSVLVKGV